MADRSPQDISELHRRYMAGQLSPPGMAAFERRYGHLLQSGSPSTTEPPAASTDISGLPNMLAYGGLRGLANMIDLPLSLANVPVEAATGYRLPGTGGANQLLESYAQATGFRPPDTFAERLTSAIGEQGTSAGVAFGAGGLAPAGSLAQHALSSGRLRTDLGLGAGAALGQATAETAAPDNPAVSTILQLIGGLIPTIPRTLGRAALGMLGVNSPTLPETTGLTAQQQATKQQFAEAGVRPAASDITGEQGVAALELMPIRMPIGGGPTQRFAEGQMHDVAGAVNRELAPMGRDVAPLEAGAAAQRELAAQRSATEASSSLDFIDFVRRLGPRTTRLQATEAARRDFGATMETFQASKKAMFDATERITGDAPVVEVGGLMSAARAGSREAAQTGFGPGAPTGALSQVGMGPASEATVASAASDLSASLFPRQRTPFAPDEIRAMLGPEMIESLRRENPQKAAVAEQFMAGLKEETPIPFWLARRIESKLGEIAFGHTAPIGTIDQGKAARLYSAVRRDIDAFLDADPAGQQIDPLLQEAKQYYRTNRTLLNDTIVSKLGRKRGGEEVLNEMFGGGRNLEPIVDLKAALSDDAWERLVASGFAQGFERSIGRNSQGTSTFSPDAAVRWGDQLRRTGKLDLLLTPPQRQEFDTMMEEMAAMKGSRITRVEDLLGGSDPERSVAQVFKPGMLGRTKLAKETMGPEVFDDLVRAWATDLREKIRIPAAKTSTGEELVSPTRLAGAVEPLARSGQLDLMMEHFPGVAEGLRELVPAFQGMGKRETLAGNPSGTGRALLAYGQIGTLANSVDDLLQAVITARPSMIGGAIRTAVTVTGLPYALSRMTTSKTGVRVLSEGLQDKFSTPALRLMERVLGAGTIPREEGQDARQ